ncbi:hypothetical protein EV651_12860 [Kribbella sp. VKM Ac-2571]|uniref:hypothetical protein n=1 Tax=Kribbella sp. VKM Ac-2571 TaxID=2512222 RepID=UPI00105C198A|nr:hypothetical protein [Kribbella sp. VKM Ac-2571]TDO45671.1 hypothetical protein EV651_12860 [Kribbella sp. VKM Ac-2571]
MKDWSCSVEFTLTRDSVNREADSHLERTGVRAVPRKAGHYMFNNTDSREDYLQALMSTIGELDAILKPYGITREICACQVTELS